MLDIFSKIADQKIKEAIEKGELKDLPGKGKPLTLEPINPFENPADRMANKIMKNLGLIPLEVELKKEIENLKKMINGCCNEEERIALKKKLHEKTILYSVIMEKKRVNK